MNKRELSKLKKEIAHQYKIKNVFIGGEFFKHDKIILILKQYLETNGLKIFLPSRIPVDDSGISAGQLIYKLFSKK